MDPFFYDDYYENFFIKCAAASGFYSSQMASGHESVDDLMHSQRFSAWNHNMEFPTAIGKQILSQQATANTHSTTKGPSFDLVSMEMDEATGGGGGGTGGIGGDLYNHSHGRGMQPVMPAQSHAAAAAAMMNGFMHHTHGLPKTVSGRKFSCKMCSQVLESKAEFQLHNQSHLREPKPYRCSQCVKAFANSSYLSQHMRIHLGIKPYACDICKKKFTQLSHLQQHIRTHTGDKPYRCPQPTCTKAFSQLSNLQSHSRCHQQDKPFKCNSCYKCFYDESSLLDHIPKHKDSKHLKTHICSYCGKSYTQETYLQRHMAKHADKAEKHQQRLNAHNHVKTSGDIYWPKQELVIDPRFSQEDLIMNYNSQYYGNAYPLANPHHHHHHPMNAYNGQTSPVNYDTSGVGKNGAASAFSMLSSHVVGRNGVNYYPDVFGAGAVNKGQSNLSDVTAAATGGANFAHSNAAAQAMRNHFVSGFANAIPTMLATPTDLASMRKDGGKSVRY